MKKTLLLLAVATMLAPSAHALSFNWSASGILYDGTRFNKTTGANVTAYLVYLGTDESYSTSYDVNKESTASSIISSVGTQADYKTGTTAAGKITQDFEFDSGAYGNGDTFGILLSYTASGTTYFNLSSSTYTLSGLTDDPTQTIADATFTFSYSGPTESKTISSGSGWVLAVPEPSTAALALAGLALLIRRRKA